jgi:hypothetical protein
VPSGGIRGGHGEWRDYGWGTVSGGIRGTVSGGGTV